MPPTLLCRILAFWASLALALAAYDCRNKPKVTADIRALWQSSTYDKYSRPGLVHRWAGLPEVGALAPPLAPPETVYISLQVNRLVTVDPKTQHFHVDALFREIWYDTRLAFNPECMQSDGLGAYGFPGTLIDELWTPDLFVEKSLDETDREDAFWVYPNGKVWRVRKTSWVLRCPMDFTYMPFDRHTCVVPLTGFAHGAAAMKIETPDGSAELGNLSGPIKFVCPELGDVEWELYDIGYKENHSHSQSLAAGTPSVAYAFGIVRNHDHHRVYTIIPTVMTVGLAWCSFFIARSAVPARTGLAIVTFLSITSMIHAVMAELPPISGFVWLLMFQQISAMFVFAAILEYAIANVLSRSEARIVKAMAAGKAAVANKQQQEQAWDFKFAPVGQAATGEGDAGNTSNKLLLKEVEQRISRLDGLLLRRADPPRMWLKDQHLDIFCRYAFPAAYVVASVIFAAIVPADPKVNPALTMGC